jgi:superfamily II DNA or RNA helicase
VAARGRDWVVLPSDDPLVLYLRPLTGGEDETTALFLPLEGDAVQPATFPPPDPARAGDAAAGLLLRDAARLSLRSGAVPLRCLGRIAVVPRPYQLVPLLLALRRDPVRLLIADDVGVGKTIEAALVARELLDRGMARRLGVLCPAHLCDQWERELRDKFALDPAVVQPSRIGRLERALPRPDLSLYQYYPHLVASIDFVKADSHRGMFLANAPDLIIVDEAHAVARPRGATEQAQHERYQLVRALAADPRRHLLLVTATPHSGIEESFRSLLGLLDPVLDQPPEGPLPRERLLPYIVQRRRTDLAAWLGATTPFPERQAQEHTYALSPAYQQLYQDVLAYCQQTVHGGAQLGRPQQRVRHWAAIALLRCVLSSPAAAVAVLAKRARAAAGEPGALAALATDPLADAAGDGIAAVDARYRPQVLDPLDDEQVGDYAPTAPLEDAEPHLADSERRRLGQFLRRAEALAGPEQDRKLAAAAAVVAELLAEGRQPIVFCRFIATAHYLAEWLPRLLAPAGPAPDVQAVTGELGEEERRERVAALAQAPRRVLVATDCLSEGINLQEHFDAVVHYDLPWNPNRLEQREGRVDRFGQRRPTVRSVLLYGADNQVDLVVLDVLIRKAREIRRALGVAVPVPVDSEQVVQAVVDTVLLRRPGHATQLQLALQVPEVSRLHQAWDRAAERERQQRAYFAQHGIRPDEVARELAATDPVLGDAAAVQRFLALALQRFGGALRPLGATGVYELVPGELRPRLAARGYTRSPLRVAFDPLAAEDAEVVGRTHPIVAACCDAVLAAALAPDGDDRFARCGAVLTAAVARRTLVLLLRLRYRLRERAEQFAEEVVLVAGERREGRLVWRQPFEATAALLEQATPTANLSPAEREHHVRWAIEFVQGQPDWYRPVVSWRVGQLQAAHDRLRGLAGAPPLEVLPHEPPDLLGCYVLVPAAGGG